MYAIIDIETTGTRPEKDKITEIAIILHDGKNVVEKYSTLINPHCFVPYYITKLTGITNEMLENSPSFFEVAKKIIELTENAVFVAHNVRFDYSFIKAAFKELGYNYNRKNLCTIRLSRSAFKGLPSYSLGNICKALEINHHNQHRALGDAEATCVLFDKILNKIGPEATMVDWLNTEVSKTKFPPHLEEQKVKNIPDKVTGVYYFYDVNSCIIYIGKALDIKKRVLQHLSLTNHGNRKAMEFKNAIADIKYEITGSELVALLLESNEIKKHKPFFNIVQKKSRSIPYYGIYNSIDKDGYFLLSIDRLQDSVEPIFMADNMQEAKELLYKIVTKYNLCLSKCNLHNTGGACFNRQIEVCNGACAGFELPSVYNLRVEKAIEKYSFKNESFFLIDKGKVDAEKSIICIEKGQYKGFGYIGTDFAIQNLDDMHLSIQKFPNNKDVQQILLSSKSNKLNKIMF